MAGYQELGSVTQLGVSDQLAQVNPFLLGTGWDVIFTAQSWNTNLTDFEIYQISLDGPLGSSVWMLLNRQPWNFVQQGWLNYNDPVQPIQMRQSDELEFCWNFAATAGPYNRTSNVQPTVTCWLRAPMAGP